MECEFAPVISLNSASLFGIASSNESLKQRATRRKSESYWIQAIFCKLHFSLDNTRLISILKSEGLVNPWRMNWEVTQILQR
jgi:hypothetical protein